MSDMLTDTTIVEKPALIVEILGVAGSGKTTLSNVLSQRNKEVLVGVHLQKISYVPFYLSTAFLLLSVFLTQYRNSRWFTWGEIRAIVYLKAWHHVLEGKTPSNGRIIVLDHGPLYRLAILREFGPEIIKDHSLSNWWDGTLNQWADTLDMIIWLDAPDAILHERIHTRKRWHQVKDISEQEGYQFLTRYRTAFEHTISLLTTANGPRILRLDTHKEPVNQTADRILNALDPQFCKS